MELIEALEKLSLQNQMLDLGKQIETIYKNCFLNQPARQHAISDIYAYRQICDDFITLCWTESEVCDSPTVSLYYQYYVELMGHLVEIIKSLHGGSQGSTSSRQSSNSSWGTASGLNSSQDDSSESMSDGHVMMEECEQFEFDQQQLVGLNWTTNKLYINGSKN